MSMLDDPRTQEEREQQQGTGGPESLGVGLEGPEQPPMLPSPNGDDEGRDPTTYPFVCPECEAEGVERRFSKQQGLSRHRTSQHGIAGTSKRTQQRKSRKAPQQKQKKPRVVLTLDTTKLIAMVQAKHPKMDADRVSRLYSWIEEAQELFDGR